MRDAQKGSGDMKTSRIYPWINDEFLIIGAEGEEAGSDQGSSGDQSGANSSDDGEENAEESSGSSQEHDDANDPKVKGLKSALEKERAARAEEAKELKELRKLKKAADEAELAKLDELEREKIRADTATERATKLASGLLTRDLNAAIRAEAEKAGFIDVDDALAGVDRESITFEQDDDDPTQITIDLKTITTQVKALAAKKPHFIKQGTDDGEATGSQFGGSKQKKKTDEETYKELYPALR